MSCGSSWCCDRHRVRAAAWQVRWRPAGEGRPPRTRHDSARSPRRPAVRPGQPAAVGMASITQLFDDLCEALLPAARAHLGQRSPSRRRAKQSLKRVAYNALFTHLFQEETPKLQPDLSRLPVKNKILMLSFDLRVGGLGPEADRLEELVEKLEATPCCPLVEVGSALDLLVQLAGSGPPQVLPRKRDYFVNNKHVGRHVPYSGYDCYDLSVFEMDVQSLISREEYLCQDMIQKALQVMEATPGTGLSTTRLFSYGDPCGDRFERDTRVSLFGALVHSRTYDMDVRLDLPPVPDSADLAGLAIKVRAAFLPPLLGPLETPPLTWKGSDSSGVQATGWLSYGEARTPLPTGRPKRQAAFHAYPTGRVVKSLILPSRGATEPKLINMK